MTNVPAPSPTIQTVLDADKDPVETLRVMARFVSENRGIAEIRDDGKLIGYVVLCRKVETVPVPCYDVATRKIEHKMLADWLHARGLDAAGSRWRQIDLTNRVYKPADMNYILDAERPKMHPLPEPAMTGQNMSTGGLPVWITTSAMSGIPKVAYGHRPTLAGIKKVILQR